MVLPLGAMLQEWRKHKQFSYIKLAEMSGVSAATLARWENGRTEPRITELEAVLTALQVSAQQREQALAGMEAPRAVKQLRAEANSAVPVSGDLLRAMRLRRRWTQQETARKAGISQGTLAKWERSEDWPTVERLHTLCYLLQAQEAELIALSRGVCIETASMRHIHVREDFDFLLGQILFASALADLEFLELETQLWRRAKAYEAAHLDLNYVYGCHARFLAERGRYMEAAEYARRAEQLARKGFRDVVGWQSAVIAEARIAANGAQSDAAHGIRILYRWLDNTPPQVSPGHHAWMYSEVAGLLVKLNSKEQALSWNKQAMRMAKTISPLEWWHRRVDYARLLAQMGDYHAAQEECDWCLSNTLVGAECVSAQLTGVEILLALGQTAKAEEKLKHIYTAVTTYPHLAHYHSQANALAARLLNPVE